MKFLSPAQSGYIAGVFDVIGYLELKRKKKGKINQYTTICRFNSKNQVLIDYIFNEIGIGDCVIGGLNVTNLKDIEDLLSYLEPYLQIQKERARAMQNFVAHVEKDNGKMKDLVFSQMKELKNQSIW
jgi:hypothetical protein